MRGRIEIKPKGPKKASPQQAVYELKHRVVLALNKIADRDTYQIGVEELEKACESLNPDGIIPFLSCILDTDSEQKIAVRKECIRMIGVLTRIHGGVIGPHLGRMVSSIVKRLKDQDSVVRDTCVDTMGVLASEFGNSQVESDEMFVLLVRPLFEALAEQNRQIQSGAGMCLARVIDNMNDPPVSILQKMLARTTKLLKNPHFLAKPAVIELNKSLIQAGGALSTSALSTALCCIQEVLKDTDWTTRKAAALALGEIASTGGPFLAPFKESCVRALEACRFDKVKPVRDAVLQALYCWKSIKGNMLDPSDSVSGTKDTLRREDSDRLSASSSVWKESAPKESKTNIVKIRAPLSSRKGSQNYSESGRKSNNSEWQIDIAVPKSRNSISQRLHSEESGSNSGTKTLETVTADVISMQDIGQEYNLVDDKQECSSASNHVADSFTKKTVAGANYRSHRVDFMKSSEDPMFSLEENSGGNKSYTSRREDRRSLDSTVTDCEESQTARVSCSQTESEMSLIRKQLAEIEKTQSSLMDLFLGFTNSTMETLSVIQMKVSSLEHAVDKIAIDLVQGGKYIEDSKYVAATPVISTTPRLSVDVSERKSLRSLRKKEGWEGTTVDSPDVSNSVTPCLGSRRPPLSMMNRNFVREGTQKTTRQDLQKATYHQKTDKVFGSAVQDSGVRNLKAGEDMWKRVKTFLCEGDLDSAYREALFSGNQLLLIELLEGTGPVLENLSSNTISDLLTTLASSLLEQRILESVIPWLQQIVDLSVTHGPNYVPLPLKLRRELISAVQEALDVEVTHPTKRRLVGQLAMKLQQIWGKMG